MEFIQNLQHNMILVSNSDNIIIMGDFNHRCTQWDSLHTNSELKQDMLDSKTALGITSTHTQTQEIQPTYWN